MRQRGDLSLHRWKTCHMDLRGCFDFCRWRRRALFVHSPCCTSLERVFNLCLQLARIKASPPPLPLSKKSFSFSAASSSAARPTVLAGAAAAVCVFVLCFYF